MHDKFEKIKQKYLASFSKKQKDLQQAWSNRDISELQNLLHKLAGSSGSYGFKELSQLCHQAMTFTRKDFDENKSKELQDVLQKIYMAMH